jgi:hypothetical protein
LELWLLKIILGLFRLNISLLLAVVVAEQIQPVVVAQVDI